MKKKLLLLMALCLLAGTNAFAYYFEDGIYYNFSGDEATVIRFTYYDPSLAVVIPDSVTYNGNTYYVTTIGNDAFRDRTNLVSITIPSTLKRVKTGAFRGCTSLTKVIVKDIAAWCGIIYEGDDFDGDFPLGLVHDKHLYSNDNTEITEVVIPEGVTRIEKLAFRDAVFVTSVTLPSSVTYIGEQAFRGMKSLTSINIPQGIISIKSSAFQDCKVLPSITVPNSVTEIDQNAFAGCNNLESISIGRGLKSIDGTAFNDCYRLTYVTLLCDSVSTWFKERASIQRVVIGNSVTNIDSQAFQGCSKLSTVTFSNNLKSVGKDAFDGTAWYNNQPNGLVYTGKIAYKYKGTAPYGTEIDIEDGTVGITEQAFQNIWGLTSISIPGSVTRIGEKTFSGCWKSRACLTPEGKRC